MPFSFEASVFISPTQFSQMVYGVDDGAATLSAVEKANIEFLVATAASTILAYIDREIIAGTFTETFDGAGSDFIMLRETPVTGLTSLKISGNGQFSTVQDLNTQVGAIAWNADGDVKLRLGTFPRGREVIQIVYQAGYALGAVPYDLRAALVQQFKWLQTSMNPGVSSSGGWLGVNSRSKMGESETKDSTIGEYGMPKEVLGWLRKYRRTECPAAMTFMRTS